MSLCHQQTCHPRVPFQFPWLHRSSIQLNPRSLIMGNAHCIKRWKKARYEKRRGKKPSIDEETTPSKISKFTDILTDEEIANIQISWPHLRQHITTILTETFLALFAENPDIKDKFFAFRNYTIEDLRVENPAALSSGGVLQRHIPRVARAVVKIANNVDNLDAVMDYLQIVGKIHHQNGIQNHEMVIIGPFFVSCAVRFLPSSLRAKKIQESWIRLFVVAVDLMKRGYPNVEIDLSEDEKNIIRRTYGLIKEELSNVGVSTFLKLFQTYSTSKMYFPTFRESPLEDLALNEALQNHGLRLMKVVEDVVRDIGDRQKVETYLSALGENHERMGIQKQYFDVMGPIFCQTIRPVLTAEGQWDSEVRNAWLHLFRIIAFLMKRGYEAAEDIEEEEDDETTDDEIHFPFNDDVGVVGAVVAQSVVEAYKTASNPVLDSPLRRQSILKHENNNHEKIKHLRRVSIGDITVRTVDEDLDMTCHRKYSSALSVVPTSDKSIYRRSVSPSSTGHQNGHVTQSAETIEMADKESGTGSETFV